MTLLAIDIGGSGSRAERSDGAAATGPGSAVRGGKADYRAALRALASRLPARGDVDMVVLGATGVISHGDPAAVAAELRLLWDARQVVIASDAVTSLIGAWGLSGGAVVSAGTGVVALGTDFSRTWVRADGWGPWIGDRGSGAWIGAQGLDAAMRWIDGRRGGSERLLQAATARYGDLRDLPVALRASEDAPARLAGFVPDIVACADGDDPVARSIIAGAVAHLADAAEAVLDADLPERVALIGGVAAIESIASGWVRAVSARHPSAQVAVGRGTALDGALALGRELRRGTRVGSTPPYIFAFGFAEDSSPSPCKEQK